MPYNCSLICDYFHCSYVLSSCHFCDTLIWFRNQVPEEIFNWENWSVRRNGGFIRINTVVTVAEISCLICYKTVLKLRTGEEATLKSPKQLPVLLDIVVKIG